MAGQWKITFAQKADDSDADNLRFAMQQADSEDAELEKLSKGATRVARESMRHIDAKKAESCRKQMLKDILASR